MADHATKMEDYYKVLHHLREFKVDRQYPYSFESKENVQPPDEVQLIVNEAIHANLLRFTGLSTDTIIIPTIPRDYFSIDSVEIKVTPVTELDPSTVTLEFHDTIGAEVPLLSALGDGSVIGAGQKGAINFKLNDQSVDPKSQVLSGIQSLSIHLPSTIESLDIIDIVFRNNSPVCTLESLELGLIDGENYIKDAFIDTMEVTIPESLLKYKYIAAAALAWLTRWEHEGQSMSDGTQKSKNYADRLLSIVDRAIDAYKNPSDSSSDDDGDINMTLVGSSLI